MIRILNIYHIYHVSSFLILVETKLKTKMGDVAICYKSTNVLFYLQEIINFLTLTVPIFTATN